MKARRRAKRAIEKQGEKSMREVESMWEFVREGDRERERERLEERKIAIKKERVTAHKRPNWWMPINLALSVINMMCLPQIL